MSLTSWFRRKPPADPYTTVNYDGEREMRLMYTTDRRLFFVSHDGGRYEVHPGSDFRWTQPEGYSLDPSASTLIEAGPGA